MDTVTRTNSAILDNYGKMKKLKNQEAKQIQVKAIDTEFESAQTLSPTELLQQKGTREDFLVQKQFKQFK